ncbi:unnamed protein product [Rotaria sp. Silwood1]|nr:unnamed protein product [Rotaria sp. Silwood1]
MKIKKRRHLSTKFHNHKIPSLTKIKLKQRSSLNIKTKNISQISRKFSSRHHVFSNEYLSKINLPKWEYISPNINHILSDKHTKSGVYAHEIHLIQQELEALLSMSMIQYYQDLLNIIKIKPLITHYTNQTILERFQTKLYQYYRKSFNYDLNNNSSLRCSTRLQKNSQLKSDHDHQQSSIFKHNKKTKFTSSLSIKIQERIQFVHDYLSDQHPLTDEYIQQQFINNIKLTNKKQKISIKNSYKNIFEKKLSILISLLNECSSLTLYALKRAYLQFNNEQTWQKLNTIQHDINLLIQNIDMTNDYNNSKNIKNIFQNLDHLLKEWTIYEEDFHHQFEQLFNINI